MVIPLGRLFPLGRWLGPRHPSPRRALLDRLHGEVVGAVRRPAFYLEYGVPDTFEGRFELLALHAGLVLRRFNAAEEPGPAVAQDFVDAVFAHLEADLREAGVGDITVPKRMKKLCEAFLGRAAAYDAGLRDAGSHDADRPVDRSSLDRTGPEALSAALARNVYAGRGDAAAADRLARYVAAAAGRLAAAPLDACLAGPLPFPDPQTIPRTSLSSLP